MTWELNATAGDEWRPAVRTPDGPIEPEFCLFSGFLERIGREIRLQLL